MPHDIEHNALSLPFWSTKAWSEASEPRTCQLLEEKTMSRDKITLIGRLEDKPFVKNVEGDQMMVGLSVTTTRHWYDPSTGEEWAGQEWHRIVITDEHLAAFAEMHLDRDDEIYIEGELRTEYQQDKEHRWHSLTTILLSHGDDQLRFLVPGEGFAVVNRPYIPTQVATQNLHRIKTSSDKTWFGKAALWCKQALHLA